MHLLRDFYNNFDKSNKECINLNEFSSFAYAIYGYCFLMQVSPSQILNNLDIFLLWVETKADPHH